jgi:hypothetical protein
MMTTIVYSRKHYLHDRVHKEMVMSSDVGKVIAIQSRHGLSSSLLSGVVSASLERYL